jgi:Fur family ferric uptake transcriptional regulator
MIWSGVGRPGVGFALTSESSIMSDESLGHGGTLIRDERVRRARRVLSEYMNTGGKRNTRQRDVIVDVFFEVGSERHLSLQELQEQVQRVEPGVGFATVYRTMKMLTDAGVAHERRFDEGTTRYELAEVGEHHDHLICIDCGHIFEFEDEVIESRQREVATRFGLEITTHRHEIYATCALGSTCERRLGWRRAPERRRSPSRLSWGLPRAARWMDTRARRIALRHRAVCGLDAAERRGDWASSVMSSTPGVAGLGSDVESWESKECRGLDPPAWSAVERAVRRVFGFRRRVVGIERVPRPRPACVVGGRARWAPRVWGPTSIRGHRRRAAASTRPCGRWSSELCAVCLVACVDSWESKECLGLDPPAWSAVERAGRGVFGFLRRFVGFEGAPRP